MKVVTRLFWVLVLVALVMILRAMHPIGQIGADLLWGWIEFLYRASSRMVIRWDGLAEFAIAFGLALVITHYLARWLNREMQSTANRDLRPWRLRSTLVLVLAVVVLFVAGIAMIGVTHQTAWIATSPEPLLSTRVDWRGATSRTHLNDLKDAAEGAWGQSRIPPALRPGEQPQNWAIALVPYFFYYSETYDPKLAWDSPTNAPTFKGLVPQLLNPELAGAPIRDAQGFGLNHYAINRHVWQQQDPANRQATDASAGNVILIGEINNGFAPWGKPEKGRDPQLGIPHPSGFAGPGGRAPVCLMLDGSVRTIASKTDPKVIEGLSATAKHVP